jgi:8-oxo-dGTP pyrophosphatase MutT (NUDIX family)
MLKLSPNRACLMSKAWTWSSATVCVAFMNVCASAREAVMIVPIVDDHLILIREYAVGTESYELGFSKGLIDPGETVFEAANRELKEEVGFGANELSFLKKLSMAPSYFSSKMNIVVAEDLYRNRWKGMSPSRCRRCAGRWRT